MPEFFPTVFGNQEAKRFFGDGCLHGTLSHAYLLEGPAGSGKKTLARAVAAALVCEKKGQADALPCGVCNRCRRVLEENAPDVKTVRATGATLGVDIIRGMREDMYLSPTEPGPKVYLIPDAHKMTPQAQNALLKVLEEPPTELVVFLLTERAEALLTTVRSRVMLIRMELFSPEEEEVFLEKNAAAKRMREKDPDAFRALLEGSGGCLGTVLDRLEGKRAEAYAKKRKEVADAVAGALKTLAECDFIAAEDTRNTALLLHHFGIRRELVSYHEHNKRQRGEELCARLLAGESCALVTDAGMPAVSDPGEDIVRLAAARGIRVSIVPGACAAVSALALSALSTGRFAFEGFLSAVRGERKKRLAEIAHERRTLIFYEAPHKLRGTLADLLAVFGDRKISYIYKHTPWRHYPRSIQEKP